ncbi:MAG: ATP-binding protein [Bacteroidetes bacterium]|nr:ATP-binding protein [Bacteroidota bacterium]
MRITRYLAFRLFVIVLFVMLVATAIFTAVMLNWHTEKYLSITTDWALRTSDLIKRSTHYSMLENRREDIYQTINTLGSEPGIEAIRIYNKRGEITYSTMNGEVGKYVNVSAEACNACHQPGKALPTNSKAALTRIFNSPKGYRVLGVITPIRNEPSCYTAPCHEHPKSQTVLGVLDVMLPLKAMDASLVQLRRYSYIGGALMVLSVTLFAGIFIWIMVNIPVRRLTEGTHEITKGNLDHRIKVHSSDEIGDLADSFNKMTEELGRARNELTEWTETLEERVEQKTDELRRALSNMVQMEKMASLGKLAASVAHELNNPLAGILAYAKLLRKKLAKGNISEEGSHEIEQELGMIADESTRCGNIVNNLLLFSRQKIGEYRTQNIRPIIEQSLKLIAHHLAMNNVKLEVDVPGTPVESVCDPQQIEQALIALEINAIEAMPEGGTLKLTMRQIGNQIEIKVIDNGIGINGEDLDHIFEPFFTTKKDGKGTGLGLAVVHGIVERHNGRIEVQSKPNVGTTFTIILPVNPGEAAASDFSNAMKN